MLNVVATTLELLGDVELLDGCVDGVPMDGSGTMGSTETAPVIVVVVTARSNVVAMPP